MRTRYFYPDKDDKIIKPYGGIVLQKIKKWLLDVNFVVNEWFYDII